MSRRAAGIINDWIVWELQSGGFASILTVPVGRASLGAWKLSLRATVSLVTSWKLLSAI
jgi:hypothetical protein